MLWKVDIVDTNGISAFGYTFTPTTANQAVVAGGQYVIGLHTIVLPDIGQNGSFLAVPSDGIWLTAGRGFDTPAGWTIVPANTDPQAGRVAMFRCDTAGSRYVVYC
jgi:hypothetical protein